MSFPRFDAGPIYDSGLHVSCKITGNKLSGRIPFLIFASFYRSQRRKSRAKSFALPLSPPPSVGVCSTVKIATVCALDVRRLLWRIFCFCFENLS